MFLLTAVLLAAALGAAVVFTYVVAERIARDAADGDLAASSRLQNTIREQRYDQLQLSSYLFVSDPFLAAYVAEAATQQDAASILDLLGERQGDLGFDFAIVLDPEGRVLARTDRPAGAGQDLSRRPLVSVALTDYEAYGVWREGDDLFHAVAVPITRGTQLVGYLVTGFAFSDATALEVKEVSGTEVAYVAAGDGAPRIGASTLDGDAEARLLEALRGGDDPLGKLLGGAMQPGTELELRLRGERWIARLSPLLDAAGGAVGAAVALTPLDAQLAPFRRIGRVLLLTGAVALLAALALTFPLARRTMAPVRELVAATAAARGGDYDRHIPRQRGDEVGELARTFDDLLSDLREKRDMETYLADLSRTLPDPSPVAAAPIEAKGGPVTLMAVELRAAAAAGGAPQAALDAFSAELGRLTQLVAARRGRLVALAGHRAWIRFAGDGRTFRAFACAAELMRSYVEAGRETEAPLVGITSGDAVWGAVAWGEERRPTTLGRPVLRLESLLREASPGDITLSPEAEKELRTSFEGAGLDAVAQRGVFSSQPLYVVQAAAAARLMGSHAMPTLATGADVGGGSASVDLHPTLSAIAPGAVVGGRFEILSVLGAGGMGVVYKARDRELDEVVAVKMLRPDQAGDVANSARLRDELRLARRITHPNVLRTFDLGEVAGIPFISMEYVRGVTLAHLLEHTDRLAYSAGLSVAKQLCQGLAAAHEVGVLHRDIKPANLILCPNGNVKLMDFGIARPLRRSEPGQTQQGWLVGTPKYLAPEQLRGEEPDARADVYACGVVLYEMFAGTSPFHGTSYAELVTQTLHEAPPPLSGHWPEVPPELERIVLRCLTKNPAERYPSAAALYADLGRLKA